MTESLTVTPDTSWLTAAVSPLATPSPEEAQAALALVEQQVRGCTLCAQLARTRTQTVFGVGNPTPRLCFVGEAPGRSEDLRGEPFVGDAGQLLTRIIEAMGLRREQVYILNTLKCRPPENRRPHPDEVQSCRSYFEAQLRILRPEIICCLGATAANALLGTAESVGAMRGKVYNYRGVPVTCTYHPAFLLRQPEKKREVWADMVRLLRYLDLPLPGAPSGTVQ